MSLDAALTIAISGLRNIDTRLATVSNNVANAGSAGYAVQTVQQASMVAGDVSEGVFTGNVVNDIDLQAQSNLLTQNGVVANLETIQTALTPVQATQGTVGAGSDLASKLGALDDSFSALANDPSSAAQQSAVVDAAQTLSDGINTLAQSYSAARQSAQNSIVSSVTTLNQALDTIGDLNDKIVAAQGAGLTTANLVDLRNVAVQTISGLLDVRVTQQNDGSIRLITPSGLALPMPDAADPQSPFATTNTTLLPTDVAATSTTASTGVPAITLNGADITGRLIGGSLGANVALRDTILPQYQAELDEFSENLATRFAGQGLSLFTTPGGTVPAASGTPTQQNYIGFANTITVNPAVTANFALVRDGTGSPSANTSGAAGYATIIDNVLNFTFGTSSATNTPYAAIPTSGLGVNGNIATNLGAPQSLSDFATAVVSSQAQALGNVSGQLTDEQAVQTTLTTQYQVSTGVDIDTELANMLQLQNAYGANAKVLTAIQQMFNELSAAVTIT